MLTPQEVSARSFTKAVMGGYNMAMVDEFLDELTDDYTSLYKENASLKAKMKVLVEKVEEYRATEDSMRAALLTAQRMADSIVREAEAKRDEILNQAESSARDKLEQFRREVAQSDERLRQGQQELQRFIAASRELCNRELQFLDKLPEFVPEESAAETIQETVQAAFAEQTPPPPPAPVSVPEPVAAPAPALKLEKPEPVAVPEPMVQPSRPKEEPKEEPKEAVDLEATRKVNLSELKFGPNYRGETR